MTTGSISKEQIEQTMIVLRGFGEFMGIPAARLEDVLDKARKDLFAGKDERPGAGGGGPPTP